ncbi:MAG: hypothetical protein IT429_10205 [Gemmataceae bacterium]|nr:hypothetical protein [Gemmataceae bacterium]
MNQRRFLILFGSVTLVILGCGDTPHVQLRESITNWNELADLVAKIPDNENAEEVAFDVYKNHVEPLEKHWEGLKKRLEKLSKLDKDGKKELEQAVGDLADDARYAIGRLEGLFGVIKKTADKPPKSLKLRGRLNEILDKQIQAEQMRSRKKQVDVKEKFPGLYGCLMALEKFAVSLPAPPTPTGQPTEKGKPEPPKSNLEKFASSWQFPRSGSGGQSTGGSSVAPPIGPPGAVKASAPSGGGGPGPGGP